MRKNQVITMVSLQLYSRGETKKYMDILFNQITQQNYTEARGTLSLLKNCLLKYYLTRDVDCSEIYETFHEFDYLLRTCHGRTKQDTCFEYIRKIRAISQLSSTDPIENLKQLYEDMRYAFLHLSKNNAEIILDCFDEIRGLQPRLQERSGSSYNYYTYVLKDIGECEVLLGDLVAMEAKIPDKTTRKNLTSNFQKLFSNIQSVFAPPVRLDVTKKDIMRHLKSGRMSELAKASGHREEELQAMLNQIESAGEEGDT